MRPGLTSPAQSAGDRENLLGTLKGWASTLAVDLTSRVARGQTVGSLRRVPLWPWWVCRPVWLDQGPVSLAPMGRCPGWALLETDWENLPDSFRKAKKSYLISWSFPNRLSKILCFNVKLPNMVFSRARPECGRVPGHVNIYQISKYVWRCVSDVAPVQQLWALTLRGRPFSGLFPAGPEEVYQPTDFLRSTEPVEDSLRFPKKVMFCVWRGCGDHFLHWDFWQREMGWRRIQRHQSDWGSSESELWCTLWLPASNSPSLTSIAFSINEGKQSMFCGGVEGQGVMSIDI